MAKIYNSNVTKGLASNAGIQINVDKVPNELAEKIVPTLETNPILLRHCDYFTYTANSATAAVTALSTIPAGRRFYLNSIQIAVTKDAACDNTGIFVTSINPLGVSSRLCDMPLQPLTAGNHQLVITYPKPILIETGSSITLGGSFAAGTLTKTICITGWFIDNINA